MYLPSHQPRAVGENRQAREPLWGARHQRLLRRHRDAPAGAPRFRQLQPPVHDRVAAARGEGGHGPLAFGREVSLDHGCHKEALIQNELQGNMPSVDQGRRVRHVNTPIPHSISEPPPLTLGTLLSQVNVDVTLATPYRLRHRRQEEPQHRQEQGTPAR